MKEKKMYQLKTRNIILSILLVTTIIFFGCKKSEENFEGLGGISNFACEGDDSILFQTPFGYLFLLDKNTEMVRFFCNDPACAHDDEAEECISNRSAVNIQYFNGNFYFADQFNGGFFKSDGNTLTQIEKYESTNYPYIYNNKLYFPVKVRGGDGELEINDFACENIDGSDRKIIPVGKHAGSGFSPYKDGFVFITDENILYYMKPDGREQKKITDDKYKWACWDEDYIYYEPLEEGKEGIYRMNSDGSGKIQIYSGDANIAEIIKDVMYVNINSGDEKGLYIMNKDGSGAKKINDNTMYITSFENYDKLLGEYIDDSIRAEDKIVIMNRDGSDCRKLELPELPLGAY